jgi:hypothetical protein
MWILLLSREMENTCDASVANISLSVNLEKNVEYITKTLHSVILWVWGEWNKN